MYRKAALVAAITAMLTLPALAQDFFAAKKPEPKPGKARPWRWKCGNSYAGFSFWRISFYSTAPPQVSLSILWARPNIAAIRPKTRKKTLAGDLRSEA